LVLPPAVAPTQLVIVPIAQHKPGVLEKANELKEMLSRDFRVKLDDSDNSAGWKFSEYEMKGVPLRLEIGPRDIENGQCVLVSRHNREKSIVSLENLNETVKAKLEEVRQGMYEKALANRAAHSYDCTSIDEINATLEQKGDGFVYAMWCGEEECEVAIKDKTGASTRCMPFAQEELACKCVHCGKPAKKMVYFGRAY
ncbi:MAG: proline--tRNA ligase, partial [Lachnospiraceae bacterium]|nr:proline--tRNA ligase [Lachnospiraceae bacterium]